MTSYHSQFFLITAMFLTGGFTSPVDYRWSLMSDGDGKMMLIDAKPEVVEPEPAFNAELDTAFFLFTRYNPTVGQRITWNPVSISSSNFNPAHPVRVMIHGFNSGPGNSINTAATLAYLQRGNFNVIV